MPASCTPEQVFDVLDDGWSYPLWVVGAARMRDVDDDWPSPGSRLHHSVGVWPLMLDDTTTVIEHERARHIRLKARAWPTGEADVHIQVTPTAAGSVVSISEDASEGPARMIPRPVRAALLRLRNGETLKRLVWLAEGRAGGADQQSRASR